jgi:hypothetical protein
MKNYSEMVKKIANADSVSIAGSSNFREDQANQRHKEVAQDILQSMEATFLSKMSALVKEIVALNVSNQGIIIGGKSQNVAFSKYGCHALLTSEGNIAYAARISAYQFSDDFRKVCILNGKHDIPKNECDFVNRCAEYDKISGWYNGEVLFSENTDERGPYIGATVSKAFVSDPDTFYFTHSFGEFAYLEGYYLSLFNACGDLISVVSKGQGKAFSRKLALRVQNTKEHAVRGKSFYRIDYSDLYYDSWVEIDAAIYCLVETLNQPSITSDDISAMLQIFKDVQLLIKKAFPNKVDNDIGKIPIYVMNKVNFRDLLEKVALAIEQYELNRYVLHCLINEVRVKYEDLKINSIVEKKH